jgi:hypothetical protein
VEPAEDGQLGRVVRHLVDDHPVPAAARWPALRLHLLPPAVFEVEYPQITSTEQKTCSR